ncbi:hypothetical protein GCM10025870_09650 [Agromyces marinus]|uniref:DUF4012 domain-containing protein n=1 Tax=Agromyces marinus TaxID=1389020 RepID=A0ABM8GZH2_9MICO|nr:DUF4012 domain-containing protein [Agromyces marinus]BDZ53892.1 hypothetical protein GCM10025870_09650 [Agromyces marinus]
MSTRALRERKPLIRSARLWVPVSLGVILLALVGVGFAGAQVAERGFAAKDELELAIPLAKQAQKQVLAGDQEGATATIAQLRTHSAAARELTDDPSWRSFEWVPVLGANLQAVRVTAASVDDLVDGVVEPATTLSLEALKPVGGAIDLVALTGLSETVDGVADTIGRVSGELDTIDREPLIGPVRDGVDQLDEAVGELEPMIEPAQQALAVLPGALGADGPRNYLVLFQNLAEARGTGGNPAALLLVNVTDGRITIGRQASSTDFRNGRPEPIIALDPETEALYGDKIGRYMMDVTLTPDFPETSEIIRAFWAESFGDQVDGVVSFDPVALGYLLGATGPVGLATGEKLTADNAAGMVLNDVYFRYEDPEDQDAFFAAAAGSVFGALMSGSADTDALVTALTRAIDEGRLMYVPSDEAEADLIDGARIAGTLPVDDREASVVGVYVNDITQGKMDYYVQLDVAAATDACTVDRGTAPTFTTTATLANTVQPDQVDGLADYIATGKYFPRGHISTDLVLYGPIGSTFQQATVDGRAVSATPLTHLGRPAVKVNVRNVPASAHTVEATFTGEAGAEYGPSRFGTRRSCGRRTSPSTSRAAPKPAKPPTPARRLTPADAG